MGGFLQGGGTDLSTSCEDAPHPLFRVFGNGRRWDGERDRLALRWCQGRGKPLNDASGSTTLKLCRLDAIWDRRAGLGRVGFDERHQAPAVIVRVVVAQNGRAARLQEHVRSTDVLAVFGQVHHAKDGDVGILGPP